MYKLDVKWISQREFVLLYFSRTFFLRKDCESWDRSAWKYRGLGDHVNIYKYLKEGCREDRAGLCSVVPSARPRDTGHKQEPRSSPCSMEALLCWAGAGALAQGPGRCEVSSLGISPSSWLWGWSPCSEWPCWGKRGPEVSPTLPIW